MGIYKCKQLFWTVRNSFIDKLYLKVITPLEKDSLVELLATFCVVFKMGTVFDHFAEWDLVSVKKTSMILVFFSYPLQRIIFKSFVFYKYPNSFQLAVHFAELLGFKICMLSLIFQIICICGVSGDFLGNLGKVKKYLRLRNLQYLAISSKEKIQILSCGTDNGYEVW